MSAPSDARRRLELLLDAGSFVELDALVAHRCQHPALAGQRPAGDGVVSGYGTVEGRLVYLFAQDAAVFGGSLGEAGGRKIAKVMDLAVAQGVPLVGLYDGSASRVPEGVATLGSLGELFGRHTRASGVVPQIAAIFGPCSGAPAMLPSLADFVVMLQDGGRLSLAEPGEAGEAGEEGTEPGGLDADAAAHTGLCHLLAAGEAGTLAALRHLLRYLPSNHLDHPPQGPEGDDPRRQEPQLDQLVPENPHKPYDIRHLVELVVDEGSWLEIHPDYARNVVVGFAHLGRRSVGIVANQPAYLAGVLDLDASLKAARFVRFCDAFGIPVISFVDVPGFMPGVRQELGGIIKHGAKLLYAYAEATVPKITVIVRKSYGGAYAVMGSKHLRTDVNLAYPSGEVAVMGPEGAVGILHRGELQRAGEQMAELRDARIADYREKFSNPYVAAQRGYLDAVIPPRATRPWLIESLQRLARKRVSVPRRKHGNLPL